MNLNADCKHGMPADWCATCNSTARLGPQVRVKRSRTYTAADLRPLYLIDPDTGCWMWTGLFRPYGSSTRDIPIVKGWGVHQVCGVAHNAQSRTVFEEQLGRVLRATENIVGTCASNQGGRHACIKPEHHVVRRGAGEMFGREMAE